MLALPPNRMTLPRPLALAALVLGLSACSINNDIEIDDRQAFAQTAQLRYQPHGHEENGNPFGFEVAFDRAEGDDDPDLDLGGVDFDGNSFPAGVTNLEWEQTSYQAGLVFGPRRSSPNYDLTFSVGLRNTDLELTLDGTEGSVEQTSIYGSLDYGYWFDPHIGMFVRGLISWSEPLEQLGFIDEDEEEFFQRLLELGVAARAGNVVALRAGWRTWGLNVEQRGESDVELLSAGPFIGLAVGF